MSTSHDHGISKHTVQSDATAPSRPAPASGPLQGTALLETLRKAPEDVKIATLAGLFSHVPYKIIAALERAGIKPQQIQTKADGPAILDIVIEKAPNELLDGLNAIAHLPVTVLKT